MSLTTDCRFSSKTINTNLLKTPQYYKAAALRKNGSEITAG
jgi:hypothetical protein